MTEQIVLETISEHANNRKVIRSNQCGFTKGISCINNLIAFYGEMTGLVGEGESSGFFFFLDLIKAFDFALCDVFIDKLMKYRFSKWTGNWS